MWPALALLSALALYCLWIRLRGLRVEGGRAPSAQGPRVPTPEGPRAPTAEGPRVPAPEGPRAPTAEGPRVPTPEGPREPTTEEPRAPSTEGPRAPFPERPRVPSTEGPRAPTAEGSCVPTPEGPRAPCPEGPRVPTPEEPRAPTAEGPCAPSSEEPRAPTTEGPRAPYPERPCVPTTKGLRTPCPERPRAPTTEGLRTPCPERPSQHIIERPGDPIPEGPSPGRHSHPITERPFDLCPQRRCAPCSTTESSLSPSTESPSDPIIETPVDPCLDWPSDPITDIPCAPRTDQLSHLFPEGPIDHCLERPRYDIHPESEGSRVPSPDRDCPRGPALSSLETTSIICQQKPIAPRSKDPTITLLEKRGWLGLPSPEKLHIPSPQCLERPCVFSQKSHERPCVLCPESTGFAYQACPERTGVAYEASPERSSVISQARPERPGVTYQERPGVSYQESPERSIVTAKERPGVPYQSFPERHFVPYRENSERPSVPWTKTSKGLGVPSPKSINRPGVPCPETPGVPFTETSGVPCPERPGFLYQELPEEPDVPQSAIHDRSANAPYQETPDVTYCPGSHGRQRVSVPCPKSGRRHCRVTHPGEVPNPDKLRHVPSQKRLRVSHSRTPGRVLLLLAHPDDECMFFSPTVISFVKLEYLVFVLCFSSGNYYNQGDVRKEELVHSCGVLGIAPSRVTVIEHRDLPDSPDLQWDPQLLSSFILHHVEANDISLILTFDEGGVSGHINHISLFNAVQFLLSEGKLHEGCSVLTLESVSIFRKYLSILDVPISWLQNDDIIFMLTAQEYRQAKKAMMCHQSQLLWFRHVYLLFSRYMWINSLSFLSRAGKSQVPAESLKTRMKTS